VTDANITLVAQPVADIDDLIIAVSNDGAISGDTATADGSTLSYSLVSTDKQETINGWNVETSADDVATALDATAEVSKPFLTYTAIGAEASGGAGLANWRNAHAERFHRNGCNHL